MVKLKASKSRTMAYYKKYFALFLVIVLANSCGTKTDDLETAPQPPNIIIIYADDLGYGDLSSYGAEHIQTPNFDKIVNGGMKFTNGYASSATCTPSRYALLTGIYPWRNRNARILPGTAPLLIDTAQMTLARMLKKEGYTTGIVGKWHLGLGDGMVDWNQHISPGPNELGFDYSFIMAATQDRVPTVYIENGYVQNLDPDDPIEISYEHNFDNQPTGKDNPELLKMKWHHGHNNSIINGIPRIGYMKGGDSAKWIDENMAETFLTEAKGFISENKNSPFFLYYALQQPHVPRTPAPEFAGKSGMGPRGDVILEADWCVGELLTMLEQEGLSENTLIIFSSDNGPVLNDGYYDNAVELVGDHDPSGGLRGGKYSLYEAGTRVPFATYWPGTIVPGTSGAVVSQLDLMSSLAELAGSEVTGSDSENLLDTFMGISPIGRDKLIIEATTRTALRMGDWVMIPPYPGPAVAMNVNIELGNHPEFQLFNLAQDHGERNNLAEEHPGKLAEMVEEFNRIRGDSVEIKALELK